MQKQNNQKSHRLKSANSGDKENRGRSDPEDYQDYNKRSSSQKALRKGSERSKKNKKDNTQGVKVNEFTQGDYHRERGHHKTLDRGPRHHDGAASQPEFVQSRDRDQTPEIQVLQKLKKNQNNFMKGPKNPKAPPSSSPRVVNRHQQADGYKLSARSSNISVPDQEQQSSNVRGRQMVPGSQNQKILTRKNNIKDDRTPNKGGLINNNETQKFEDETSEYSEEDGSSSGSSEDSNSDSESDSVPTKNQSPSVKNVNEPKRDSQKSNQNPSKNKKYSSSLNSNNQNLNRCQNLQNKIQLEEVSSYYDTEDDECSSQKRKTLKNNQFSRASAMTSIVSKDQEGKKDANKKQGLSKPVLHQNTQSNIINEDPKTAPIFKLSSETDSNNDSETSEKEDSQDEHLLEKLMGKGEKINDESSSSDEEDEDINLDPEYKSFIEKYGHLDFYLLNFLPKIKSKSELLDIRKKQQDKISMSRSNQTVTKNCERMARFQANSELGQIKEELEEEQYGSETDNTRGEQTSGNKSPQSKKQSIYPQLFDFRFNNKYFILNIKIDEKGERIQALSTLQGRVVSQMPLSYSDPNDQNTGTVLSQNKFLRETIPLDQQTSKYYFQYRIDSLSQSLKHSPRICIGVCREDFLINQDLSSQKNVWCINLNTGDVFTDKRWKEYYDLEHLPPYKYNSKNLSNEEKEKLLLKRKFKTGSVIGVLVDMDRGIINFFKDGKDLGQAFCQPQLKKGSLYPFVQVQDISELSIFHKSVYPKLKDPVSYVSKMAKGAAEGIHEPEPQPRRSSASRSRKSITKRPTPPEISDKRITIRESYKVMRKSMTKKQNKIKQKSGTSISRHSKQSIHQSQQSFQEFRSNRQTMNWDNISKIEPQRDQADSFLDKIREEKRILQLKELELQSVRSSHKLKEEQMKNSIIDQQELQSSFQYLIQDQQLQQQEPGDLGDLNMQNLIRQKDDDVMRIQHLQKQNEEYSQRMTVGDVNNFLAGKFMQPSTESLGADNCQQTTDSHQMQVINLQQEIEKNMLEIELLKRKLQAKNNIINQQPDQVRLRDRPSVSKNYFSRPTIFPFFGQSAQNNADTSSLGFGECGSGVTQFLCGYNGVCSGNYGHDGNRPTSVSNVSGYYPGIDQGELVGNFGSNNFRAPNNYAKNVTPGQGTGIQNKNNNFDYYGQSSDYALNHMSFEARKSNFKTANRQMRAKSPQNVGNRFNNRHNFKDPNIMQECNIF